MRTQSEDAICEPERELSLDTKSADFLILDFPVSRTVKNKFVVYKIPST